MQTNVSSDLRSARNGRYLVVSMQRRTVLSMTYVKDWQTVFTGTN